VAQLIADGRITWSGGRPQSVQPVRVAPGPPLSDYVAEDRR
jgi:hypothetical protein